MTAPQLAPALGKQCADIVRGHDAGLRLGFPCRKPAKYHEEGHDWCRAHTPSFIRAVGEKMAQRVREEQEADRLAELRDAAEHAALAGIANPAAVPEVIQATRLFWNWAQPLYRCPCCQGLVHEKGCLVANLGDALTAVDKKGE